MGAELLATVLAAKIAVRVLREAFRMTEKSNLPACQKRNGKRQETPCVAFLDKEQRREHHGIVPIVDAAGGTALVFQEPGLERTKEQDTDDVTDSVSS